MNRKREGNGGRHFIHQAQGYIFLANIAHHKNSELAYDLIRNWFRNRNTIEFLGIWENLNNPDFKPVEFDGFKKSAGLNSFALMPRQWIEKPDATAVVMKRKRSTTYS